MVDSQDNHTVRISFKIEERFEFRLKVIFFCIYSIGFELLTDDFFDQNIFEKELFGDG